MDKIVGSRTLSVITLLVCVCLSSSLALALPGTWKGYVTIDGSAASSGAAVWGYVDGVKVQSKQTNDPSTAPDNYYILDLVGQAGDQVTFKVYGVAVNEAARNWSEGIHYFNISLTRSSAGGACAYGNSWADSACSSGLTCCSDNTCKSSCSSSSSGGSSGSSGGGGGGGGGGATVGSQAAVPAEQTCVPEWTCSEWGSCVEGHTGRVCTDGNACGSDEGRPEELKECGDGSGEERPPGTQGSVVGEEKESDGALWRWDGSVWVKEGSARFDELAQEQKGAGEGITGASVSAVAEGSRKAALAVPLVLLALVGSGLVAAKVLARRRKRKH